MYVALCQLGRALELSTLGCSSTHDNTLQILLRTTIWSTPHKAGPACGNLFSWVQKTFLKILVSPSYVNPKTCPFKMFYRKLVFYKASQCKGSPRTWPYEIPTNYQCSCIEPSTSYYEYLTTRLVESWTNHIQLRVLGMAKCKKPTSCKTF
jgi:hypothetical protein